MAEENGTQNDAVTVAEAASQAQQPGPGDQTQPEGPKWSYAEGVPGQGEPPDFFKSDKYKYLIDQAKAYPELESKLGSFTGAPESYEINVSEALKEKGVEITEDDPIMEEAIKFAKNSNMNQDGFDSMMELYGLAKVAENEASEKFLQDEIKSLGNNGEERLNNIEAWSRANLPADLHEGLMEMAVSANAVKSLERLIAMTRNAPISSSEAVSAPSGISEEELYKMQFEKDEHGNRRLQTDPEFRKKFDKLKLQVWGGEDHKIIVGGGR